MCVVLAGMLNLIRVWGYCWLFLLVAAVFLHSCVVVAVTPLIPISPFFCAVHIFIMCVCVWQYVNHLN